MTDSPAYDNYWERKRLRALGTPTFPVKRLWEADGLSETEQLYFDAVRGAARLLDVGAGDHRVKRLFQAAGFAGSYETLDVSQEQPQDHTSIEGVEGTFDAILFLDTLEHLPLDPGLTLLNRLVQLLNPGGKLLVQTPNARCIRSPSYGDMTHLHGYNLPDLWAYLTTQGMSVEGYRVVLGAPPRTPWGLGRHLTTAFLTTRVLGVDYADNIALIATKT